MLRHIISATFTASLVLATSSYAVQVVETAVADGGVLEDFPGFTPTGDTMSARWNGGLQRSVFVKFDLSGVDNSQITQATFSIVSPSRDGGSTPITSKIYGLNDGNDGWDEASLSFNSASFAVDGEGNVLNATDFGTLQTDATGYPALFTLTGPDLVNYLQTSVGADGLVTFVIDANGGDNPWNARSYAMRESTEHAAPTLTLEVIPEPASLALLGLGGLALVARRRQA